ncbi:uncharacterized protein BDZ99DRAFT_455114 [Mytilinidion resinicola]|uniref:Zn(2)-C6 fungal-type domain-containing protein n=1 Tax=Mytilinidion resinicola TaxID=574789 RepID=A0A6A6Y277_9PEZI|nr:uncharacterized protein BDZ99DRAFT_455114 [Mytilinidion resinicola]KAF2802325.1 hypothetical protein BDZ99DRAFT_455114 [Mytilinidion resinicola]
MPGVPSGRGCDGCRKQKKKCDQIKPTCSRCRRLQLTCIGSGERRFKFHQQMVILGSTRPKTVQRPVTTVSEIPRSPSSSVTTTAASAFVSVLEVTDLRFDLTYFGTFLRDIPSRLGSNSALDASVKAVTIAHRSIHTRRQSWELYDAYVDALKTLRICLNEHDKSQTPNTLCAIYLIMICQGWIGQRDDQFMGHGEAVTHLLNEAAFEDWRGTFEKEMLLALCVVLIAESFDNPRIRLDTLLWTLTMAYGPPRPNENISLYKLAKIPTYLRDPLTHFLEMKTLYRDILIDLPKLHSAQTRLAALPGKFHAQAQALYGTIAALTVILNAALRAFDPYDVALGEDAAMFHRDILLLAEEANPYRPLAAGYMPLCLVSLWGASTDAVDRVVVEQLLADYQTDFEDARWTDMARWLKGRLNRIRRIAAMVVQQRALGGCYEPVDADGADLGEAVGGGRQCCVM